MSYNKKMFKIGDLVKIKKAHMLADEIYDIGIVISFEVPQFNPQRYEMGIYFQNGSLLWYDSKEIDEVFGAKI